MATKLSKAQREMVNWLAKSSNLTTWQRRVNVVSPYFPKGKKELNTLLSLAEIGLVARLAYDGFELTDAGWEAYGMTKRQKYIAELRAEYTQAVEWTAISKNTDTPSTSPSTVVYYRTLYKNLLMTIYEVGTLERQRVFQNRQLTETELQWQEQILTKWELWEAWS